jgi:hypothetical protein
LGKQWTHGEQIAAFSLFISLELCELWRSSVALKIGSFLVNAVVVVLSRFRSQKEAKGVVQAQIHAVRRPLPNYN